MWLKYAVSVFRRFSTRYFGICHFFLRYCGIGYPPMSPSLILPRVLVGMCFTQWRDSSLPVPSSLAFVIWFWPACPLVNVTLNLPKADLATERERYLTTGMRAERTKLDRLPVPNLPLSHWSSQLSDLRAPSSTDVPVLLLNQRSWLEHKVPSSLILPLVLVGMCVTQ